MRERDQRDRTRAEAPLVQAPDAQLIETTGLNIEQVEEAVLKVIRARTSNGKTASFSGKRISLSWRQFGWRAAVAAGSGCASGRTGGSTRGTATGEGMALSITSSGFRRWERIISDDPHLAQDCGWLERLKRNIDTLSASHIRSKKCGTGSRRGLPDGVAYLIHARLA